MATLNISDLSVGDWVMVECPDRERWPGRLTRLSETCGIEVSCTNGKHVRCSSNFISSIPITAEILEQNGFEKAAIGDIYRHESDIEVTLYGDGWWHTIGLDEYSLHKINGVHQLQHLLRLYGEYREVNL